MAAPEVRQCQDTESQYYGYVAVKSDVPQFAWGVFSPTIGGHWEIDDSIVGSWAMMAVSA
jgi:hypothetical protein